MAGLALLAAARAAELTIRAEGAQLVIRGPRSAAPHAQALLARKPCVLAALAVAPSDEFGHLRARLTCGCLNGYGRVALTDGSLIYDVVGYARRRLADLEDPRVANEAARRLRVLAAELARLDAPYAQPMAGGQP
jgi:hypothetical protein